MHAKTPLFIALTFFSAHLLANDNSLSFEFARSHETLEGQNRDTEIEPATLSVYYQLAISDALTISGSVWLGGDKIDTGLNNFELEQNLSGVRFEASYFTNNWAWSNGLIFSKRTLEARSVSTTDFYEEALKSIELFSALSYTWTLSDWDLSPELGLSLQSNKFEARRDLSILGSRINDQRNQEESGSYGFASVALAYWLDSEHALWRPSLSLGWSEPISGEVDLRDTRRVQGTRSRTTVFSDQAEFDSDNDGSGYAAFALLFMRDDWHLQGSYFRTLGLQPESHTLSIELGFSY